MNKFLLLCFWICISSASLAQERDSLLSSRRGSFYNYIYSITPQEAHAYTEKYAPSLTNMVRAGKLLDSFPSHKSYEKTLPTGYYLFVYAYEHTLQAEMHSVAPYEVHLLNNETDFQAVVHDTLGQPIKDADLRLKKRKVSFNPKSQTYKINKTNKEGWLTVTYKGFTSYHQIEKERKNARLRRIGRKILWFPPVRIISYPIRAVVHGVKDIIHSIKDGYPRGFVYRLFGLFDKEEYSRNHWKNQKEGYMVLNKPMYRPNDTLKMKAVILDRKGRPYQKPVQLILDHNEKIITTLKPQNKLGVYTFELPLSDTLKLKLDGHGYSLKLKSISKKPSKSTKLISAYFQYKDYELQNNTYTFNLLKEGKPITDAYTYPLFYEKEPIVFLARGKDANGLNVLDARLKLYILTHSRNAVAQKTVFVPDTLWQKDLNLDAIGETKIVLPDSLLPKAFMQIDVQAIFLNSNQERTEKTLRFQYTGQPKRVPLVTFDLRGDSLFINPKRVEAGKEVTLLTTLGKQKQPLHKNIRLPYTEKVNPLASLYKVRVGKEEQIFEDYLKEGAMLAPYSSRDKDSLKIVVQNPRNLPFWYTIYYKNTIIARGYDTKLAYLKPAQNNQIYSVAIQYIWKGKKEEENYAINFDDYALQVAVNQPQSVYPGQKTNIEISVKDVHGKPVPNADLTAYSFTKKFQNVESVSLPTFYKRKKARVSYNSFTEYIKNRENKTEILDWAYYKNKMGLDTLELYKLMYPENGRYEHYIKTNDSITEFSVYATNKNGFQKIYWIDIDNEPAYFERAWVGKPYSIPINKGFHNITFRTFDKIIEVRGVLILKGTKLILNINTDITQNTQKATKSKIIVQDVVPKWTWKEQDKILRYLMPYNNPLEGLTYLEQAGKVQILLPSQNFNPTSFLYPVLPRLAEIRNLNLQKEQTTYRLVFEPYHRYQMPQYKEENTIKMLDIRQWQNEFWEKKLLPVYSRVPKFHERLQTKAEIEKYWQYKLKEVKTLNYHVDSYSRKPEYGTMSITPEDTLKKYNFKYWILESEKQAMFRIYRPDTYMFRDLPKGDYTLYLLTEHGTYFQQKFQITRTDGTLFILPTPCKLLPADSTSERIITKYNTEIYKQNITNVPQTFEYRKQSYNPFSNNVRGRVTDMAGEGLPGVAVFIVGTTTGTSTDANGNYSIAASVGYTLKFTLVGFEDTEVLVEGQHTIDVVLKDSYALQDVVLTGYSSMSRTDFTGSAGRVSSKNIESIPISSFDQILQGRSSGISLNYGGQPGASSQITIRGVGSLNQGGEPLYILDGVPINASDFAALNPSEFSSITVLKDENAARYGSRAANGVIVISTKRADVGAKKMLGESLISETTLLPLGGNSLRRNFSDYAYWQPNLRTDRAGKASFEVTFPDDITNWRTFVYAHTAHKQVGKAEGEIKAFKSLVGELAVPRFLVEGDSVKVLGKVLNYTSDTLQIKTAFTINGKANKTTQHDKIIHSAIDSLYVVANHTDSDSLQIQYEIENTHGYRDGELRNIPLYRQGTEEAKGQFLFLRNDTTLTIDIAPEKTAVQVYMYANSLDWVLQETQKLHAYKYLCNEQLASKIQGLLAERQVQALFGKPFQHEAILKKHIQELCKRQRKDGYWGWWQDTDALFWITSHALNVLLEAKKQGFEVNIAGKDFLVNAIQYELKKEDVPFQKMTSMVAILRALEQPIDLKPHLAYWQDSTRHTKLMLTEKFNLWQLMASADKQNILDSIKRYEQKTIFGGMYFGIPNYNLWDNHIQTTLLAYQILQQIGGQESRLEKIRDFFIGERGNLAARNTYEVARILAIILPDMLKDKTVLKNSEVHLEGIIDKKIKDFPCELAIKQKGTLTLRKTGDYPVYIAISEKFWNPSPQKEDKNFKITTYFSEKTLLAGKPITLTAKVEVLKNAEYTMVEIPIPAGCSYQNTLPSWGNNEIYREYFREKVCIYCQKMPVGTYTYEVSLLPRYTGSYTLNPARLEMMYFPMFFGRNESKRIDITEK